MNLLYGKKQKKQQQRKRLYFDRFHLAFSQRHEKTSFARQVQKYRFKKILFKRSQATLLSGFVGQQYKNNINLFIAACIKAKKYLFCSLS